jgi:PadR family transcriptional regulator PadR
LRGLQLALIPYNADTVPLGLRRPLVVGALPRPLRGDGKNGELRAVVVPRLTLLRVCTDDYAEKDKKVPDCDTPVVIWTFQRRHGILMWIIQRSDGCQDQEEAEDMDPKKSEVLQGTLDLMILKTLHALGRLHGFGIARRIEQVSRDVLQLNEGTVYTSLLRLQQQGWIAAEWGTSENNRKAKFYSITKRGQKQLDVETENWERISAVIGRVLRLEAER